MTKTIQTFPVNERGEIVAQQGIGTANVVGYLQVNNIPVDEASGKVLIKLDSSSSTTLQQTYNNSSDPEITTDSTRGALTIKRGSSSDTDNLLELKNGASVTILNVTAEGKLSTTGSIAVGTSLPANGKFEIVGTTGDNPNNFATGYGVNGSFLGRRANGTEGSPTALTSGQNIVVFGGRGYGATGFSSSSRVSIQMRSAEAWTDTAQGTSIGFYTTTIGTTTPAERITISDAGNIGLNNTNPVTISFSNRKNITGGVTAWGQLNDGVIQSDVTTSARMYASTLSTQAASFTLAAAQHYRAEQGTIGAGSAVTDQRGFFAASSLIGATNNYGFYGDIPAGADRYNLYMNGTADNYLAGRLLIKTIANNGGNIEIGGTASSNGTAGYGLTQYQTIPASVTSLYACNASLPSTVASSFNLSDLRHYSAAQGTFGVGSGVTNQYGFHAGSSLTGATNNYAFYGNLSAATGRWNLYMTGTASNYLAGTTLFGTITDDGVSKVQVSGKMLISDTIRSTSKSVVSTNSLTTATLSAQRTYFTGTAGASFQLTLPSAGATIDGLIIVVMSTAARASTTWVSTGATFVGAPSSLTANVPVKFQYDHATTQWFITS